MLEAYLRGVGERQINQLKHQQQLIEELTKIADSVQSSKVLCFLQKTVQFLKRKIMTFGLLLHTHTHTHTHIG
jgi:hypothetical protein